MYIQYWLIDYNTTCPSNWNQFSFSGDPDILCWRNNSIQSVPVPNQPITNLRQLRLTGTVSAGSDSVNFASASNVYSAVGDDSVNAAAGWNSAEFGVFGNGGNALGGGQATFNDGSTIVPRTRIVYGGIDAPNCVSGGFTGETNNLSFGPAAPVAPGSGGPALLSTQSSTGGSPTSCAAATTVGGTPPECVACNTTFDHCVDVICPHTANPLTCEDRCYDRLDACIAQNHCLPQ